MCLISNKCSHDTEKRRATLLIFRPYFSTPSTQYPSPFSFSFILLWLLGSTRNGGYGKKHKLTFTFAPKELGSIVRQQTNVSSYPVSLSTKRPFWLFFSSVLHPAMSVGRSVPFWLFRRFWAFWAYGSCPDALLTFSSTAPARPHATRVAVYLALFMIDWKLHILFT